MCVWGGGGGGLHTPVCVCVCVCTCVCVCEYTRRVLIVNSMLRTDLSGKHRGYTHIQQHKGTHMCTTNSKYLTLYSTYSTYSNRLLSPHLTHLRVVSLKSSLSPTQSATHQYSGIMCTAVATFLKECKQRKVRVVSRPYCYTKTSLCTSTWHDDQQQDEGPDEVSN